MSFRQQFTNRGKGTWSTYDIHDNPEWKLAESIALEFCDVAGIEVVYYRQDPTVEQDILYGEAQNKEYVVGKPTKIVFEVGEIPTTYSMFGMIATDQLVAHIPQSTYRRDVSQTIPPKVGDVVVVPFYRDIAFMATLSGRTFEVIHVAQDQNIFQLNSLVYSIYMIPYRFSEESETARAVSMDIDDLYDPNNALGQRYPETDTPSITAYGDNEYIEEQSQLIDDYDDVDRSIYGKE